MENLRRIRKAKGLTQKELGKMVDVSESMIGMIEKGTRSPSFELLLKLGEALDCSIDDLLRGNKNTATKSDGNNEAKYAEFIDTISNLSEEQLSALLLIAKTLAAGQ